MFLFTKKIRQFNIKTTRFTYNKKGKRAPNSQYIIFCEMHKIKIEIE